MEVPLSPPAVPAKAVAVKRPATDSEKSDTSASGKSRRSVRAKKPRTVPENTAQKEIKEKKAAPKAAEKVTNLPEPVTPLLDPNYNPLLTYLNGHGIGTGHDAQAPSVKSGAAQASTLKDGSALPFPPVKPPRVTTKGNANYEAAAADFAGIPHHPAAVHGPHFLEHTPPMGNTFEDVDRRKLKSVKYNQCKDKPTKHRAAKPRLTAGLESQQGKEVRARLYRATHSTARQLDIENRRLTPAQIEMRHRFRVRELCHAHRDLLEHVVTTQRTLSSDHKCNAAIWADRQRKLRVALFDALWRQEALEQQAKTACERIVKGREETKRRKAEMRARQAAARQVQDGDRPFLTYDLKCNKMVPSWSGRAGAMIPPTEHSNETEEPACRCRERALPFSSHCYHHIMHDRNQVLYRQCKHVSSVLNTSCFNVVHVDSPDGLCHNHAAHASWAPTVVSPPHPSPVPHPSPMQHPPASTLPAPHPAAAMPEANLAKSPDRARATPAPLLAGAQPPATTSAPLPPAITQPPQPPVAAPIPSSSPP